MSELYHHGVLGQKWGIRNYQNQDGSLTELGRKRKKQVSTVKSTIKKGTDIAADTVKKGVTKAVDVGSKGVKKSASVVNKGFKIGTQEASKWIDRALEKVGGHYVGKSKT